MQLRVDVSKNLQRVQHKGIGFICILKKETACDNQNFTASKHISHGDNRIRMTLLNEWGYYKREAEVNLIPIQDNFLSRKM